MGTGLSEDAIISNLKTRSFASSANANMDEDLSADEEVDFCVICQVLFLNK